MQPSSILKTDSLMEASTTCARSVEAFKGVNRSDPSPIALQETAWLSFFHLQSLCKPQGTIRLRERSEEYHISNNKLKEVNSHQSLLNCTVGLQAPSLEANVSCQDLTWPAPGCLVVRWCRSAMTAPKAACRPAKESPKEMFGRTGGRSSKPLMCLQ